MPPLNGGHHPRGGAAAARGRGRGKPPDEYYTKAKLYTQPTAAAGCCRTSQPPDWCCINPACKFGAHAPSDVALLQRILDGHFPDLPLGPLLSVAGAQPPHSSQTYALCNTIVMSLQRVGLACNNMPDFPAPTLRPIEPKTRLKELIELVAIKMGTPANCGFLVRELRTAARILCEALCKVSEGLCPCDILPSMRHRPMQQGHSHCSSMRMHVPCAHACPCSSNPHLLIPSPSCALRHRPSQALLHELQGPTWPEHSTIGGILIPRLQVHLLDRGPNGTVSLSLAAASLSKQDAVELLAVMQVQIVIGGQSDWRAASVRLHTIGVPPPYFHAHTSPPPPPVACSRPRWHACEPVPCYWYFH